MRRSRDVGALVPSANRTGAGLARVVTTRVLLAVAIALVVAGPAAAKHRPKRASAPAAAHAIGGLPTSLTPLERHTTDRVIARDLDAIDAWQAKVATLPGAGADVWRAAAARAWLDAARVEYTDNDQQGFPQAAFERAVGLIGEIEAGKAPVDSANAPAAVIPRGSTRVADALYARLDSLKHNPGFRCAREPLAQLEVELAWAGNEQVDQGDCRTSPHLARAAALAESAQAAVERCVPPPTAAIEAPPVPEVQDSVRVVPAPVPTKEELRIPRNVHFALNRFDISPTSRDVIAGIVALLDKYPSITVRLVGHTDSRGSSALNLTLSKRRVDMVRDVIVALGIAPARLSTHYRGKSDLYAIEDSKKGFALNRRVEMVFVDAEGRDIRGEAQEGDLQIEKDRAKAHAGAKASVKKATVKKATVKKAPVRRRAPSRPRK
jgi:outer membrane protein OmpA-like peptidoglycan-associated protein